MSPLGKGSWNSARVRTVHLSSSNIAGKSQQTTVDVMIHIQMYINLCIYMTITVYLLTFWLIYYDFSSLKSPKVFIHGILRSVPSDPVISITTSRHLHELKLVRWFVSWLAFLPNFSGNPFFLKDMYASSEPTHQFSGGEIRKFSGQHMRNRTIL